MQCRLTHPPLADIYRDLFPFGVFNAVQSSCFSQVIEGDENMVICAPTGSGKTVLFELAMIRFLEMNGVDDSRCIYIAPTKVSCRVSRTSAVD
jgi:ATP-dependent DNA helicase HFM1/MER3